MGPDLCNRLDALKLRLLGAFSEGRRAKIITEEQEDALIDLIDRMDEGMTTEAVERIYRAIIER